MLMSCCLVISNKRVLFKHNQFLGFIWLYGRRETFCVIGITMHHIVSNYHVYKLCSNSDIDCLTNGYIPSILRMLILYQGLNFFMYLQKVFTHMIQVQTLDISRYNIIRYCPQHNCEGNTSVVLRTHERHPYLASYGCLSWVIWRKVTARHRERIDLQAHNWVMVSHNDRVKHSIQNYG